MADNNNNNNNKKKFFTIMTAIAYPNGRPHMGHALEIIQADALARFYRVKGEQVYFQTGTDEHGKKNWQTAEKEGKTINQFLDDNVKVFKELYQALNISNDYFIRTSDKEIHYKGSQALWMKLHEQGDLYKQVYKGLYCVGCEGYKTEKELVDGKCPDHTTRTIETVEEENYFFRLSKYAAEVSKRIESDELKIVPAFLKKEILYFLSEAKDISFSRPAKVLPWGVPVPNDPEHVMYVWCDALSNYITATGYGQEGREAEFNDKWPCDIQVLGRDILRFHAAYWPAMLLSCGVKLPRELFVHGFLKLGGLKMGKSTGNVIYPEGQISKYGVDPFRFYILGSIPVDADGEYTITNLEERINNELVANFSNLCYRSLSVLANPKGTHQSKISTVNKNDPLIAQVTPKFEKVIQYYEQRSFREVVSEIMEISALGNKFLQDKQPWKNLDEAPQTLALCVNLIKNISILLSPIMPGLCTSLRKQLNVPDNLTLKDLTWDLENHTIGTPEILVKRLEVEKDTSNNNNNNNAKGNKNAPKEGKKPTGEKKEKKKKEKTQQPKKDVPKGEGKEEAKKEGEKKEEVKKVEEKKEDEKKEESK